MNEQVNEQVTEEVEKEVSPVIAQVKSLTITDTASEEIAGNTLITIKSLRKKVEEEFGPAVKAAHTAHKAACAVRDKFDKPLKSAEAEVKRLIADYRRKLLEAARKEEQRLAREAEAKARAEREKELEAARAEQNKAKEKVLEQVPIQTAPAPKVEVAAAPSGVTMRDKWSAQIVDKEKFVKAVAFGTVELDAVTPNMSYLNGIAREGLKIPGVVMVNNPVISSRSVKPVAKQATKQVAKPAVQQELEVTEF